MKRKLIPQPGEPDGASPQRPASPTHRILVVDDDSDIRRLNAEVLKRSGYGVDAAADGADAWQALNRKSYDLLITDNMMPGISGVELLLKLRGVRMTLPVILVSGTMPVRELSRHPWLQFEGTLMKPFTADELLATVRIILRSAGVAGKQKGRPPIRERPPSAIGLRPRAGSHASAFPRHPPDRPA